VTGGFTAGLKSLTLLAIILGSTAEMGHVVLAGILGSRSRGLTLSERWLFSVGLGIILLSLGVLFLGTQSLFNRWTAAALIASFYAVPVLMQRNLGLLRELPAAAARTVRPFSLWFGISFVILGLSWLQTLVPPTGNDALAYHLAHPKTFLVSGRIEFLPDLRESLWPFQTEMLFTLGLLLEGTTLAKMFHWMFFPLTALTIYAMAQRFHGVRTARWSALTFLITPAVFVQSGYAYVDLALAFYVSLAIYAFLVSGKIATSRFAVLTGCIAGGAAATKQLGLGVGVVLGVLWLIRSGSRLRHVLIFLVMASLLGGIWYLRSWIHWGNPVYPFFASFFGDQGYESEWLRQRSNVGMGHGPISLFLFPWNITMFPHNFGGPILGPLYLMFVPWLVGGRGGMRRDIFYAVAYTGFFSLFLFGQSHQVRFLLSVVPLLAWGCGVSIARFEEKGDVLRRFSRALVSVVLVIHLGLYLYRLSDNRNFLAGRENTQAFLLRKERSSEAHLFLSENVKPGESVLNAGDLRTFYNAVPGVVVYSREVRARLARQAKSLEDYLRESEFDWIWTLEETQPEIREYLSGERYRVVFRYDFVEGDRTFRNRIWKRLAR